jgi:hypothetical protein
MLLYRSNGDFADVVRFTDPEMGDFPGLSE